ncbi:sugar phosphate isomerase/epimerase family protein [Thalassospira tepidiphila]|uniref:sugar phosphate isomerase/epimerase family protein n=1 Tax=Thalassospira tepidiphila TaxID=393657 RepID=UPI003AA8F8DC
MNSFGIHALVWVTDWDLDSIRFTAEQTAAAGYGMVEAVIFDPSQARPAETAKVFDEFGLDAITGMALNASADISSPDKEVARAGEALISDAILATRDMGSKKLGGVTHSAMRRYLSAPDPDAFQRVAEVYARLADRAREAGIQLGIEAVNRYESNIVNTVDEAARLVREVDESVLFAHIDTFHMNIEEHNVVDTITRNIDVIGHVHIGESHRGYLGSGSVDFAQTFQALARAGYEGPIVLEAFSSAVLNSSVADALACWTSSWNDPMDLAQNALAYMKFQSAAAQHGLISRENNSRRTV